MSIILRCFFYLDTKLSSFSLSCDGDLYSMFIVPFSYTLNQMILRLQLFYTLMMRLVLVLAAQAYVAVPAIIQVSTLMIMAFGLLRVVLTSG